MKSKCNIGLTNTIKPQQPERYKWIDALKGIALLLVIIIHTGQMRGVDGFFSNIIHHGWTGAILFFLISAFLLWKSLHIYFTKNTFSLSLCITWIRDKFFSFIPLFYLAILCGLFWNGNHYWLGSEKNITIGNIIAHLFFAHNFFPHYCNSILGIEWYIGVLGLFVWIAPFIFKYINSFSKSFFLFCLSIPVVHYINIYLNTLKPFSNKQDIIVYHSFINSFGFFEHLPTILWGIVLYYVFKHINMQNIKNKTLLSYTLLFTSFALMYGNLYAKSKLFLVNQHTLWALIFSLMIISQMLHQNKLVCNKIFQIIGKYSFPMYLFHFFLVNIYRKYLVTKLDGNIKEWLLEFIFVLTTSLLVSYVLTKFFNKPATNWLRNKTP